MTQRAKDELVEAAIDLVRQWLTRSKLESRRQDRAVAARLHALVDERAGVEFAMRYVDRIARHRDDTIAAEQLAALVERYALPAFLGVTDRFMLKAGAKLAPMAPSLVMPLARRRLRQLVGHLVVDATPTALSSHIESTLQAGVDLNINLLGEAVLGEAEAARRLERTLQLTRDPAMDYVSVKVSAIASQLDLWSFDDSVGRVSERLRELYRAGASTSPATFVNLDMEDYDDLRLTLRAFMDVLGEPEFVAIDAGIVLQAYLPESYQALQQLTQWAIEREAQGGGTIKVRLVKGANLAVERVHAALHGWTQAPFASKAEVDANYKRCLWWALTPERTTAVRIGVASHNLFDMAWAKLLVDQRGVASGVDFEMLQGMAAPEARVVREDATALLLYTPIVAPQDFDVAISYLIRRLEENASGDNFLHYLFDLEPDTAAFDIQADLFRAAVQERDDIASQSRRGGRRPTIRNGFANHPDTDPALEETQTWLRSVRAIEVAACTTGLTTDPGEVRAAVARGRGAQPGWWELGADERRRLLWQVSDELDRRRGELLATMASEAGKTFAEADPEISEAIDFARWYAERAGELESVQGARFEPHGVVAVIPPWNFPVAIAAGGVFAALAAGNAVVLKPAPQTPRCAEIVAEAVHAAGVPHDVFQFVRTGDDKAGQALVTGANAVILTGSAETAGLFRTWKPDIVLMAETSGKNSLVVTPHADTDLAVADLAQSAFGHAGQKCSAASLAILVGGVGDDQRFKRQLVDAVNSFRVGWPTEEGPNLGPVIGAAEPKLIRALGVLEPGETWLVEPKLTDRNGTLWSPGVRDGVAEGSWFHQTECFGPVLGLMRARDLAHAIAIQNHPPFGLTGGIHSLDEAEIDEWLRGVEVGNAYVNRAITGAIVGRQPFGGWKGSSVGPGAKAGGPDYLLQLGTWVSEVPPNWAAAQSEDERWWSDYYSKVHDPTDLFCEANELRYVAHPHCVIRAALDTDPVELERTFEAARRVLPNIVVSVASRCAIPGEVVENDHEFEARLPAIRWGRVRMVGTVPETLRLVANEHQVHVIDQPVTVSGRLELRHYVREQAVSRTLHRFGNVSTARPLSSRS